MDNRLLKISKAWYGKSTYAAMLDWTSTSVIWSGSPPSGGHYCTKLSINVPTGSLDDGISKQLALELPLYDKSYPIGCMAVLSDNGNLTGAQVYNDSVSGPSDTLLASALATSIAYNGDGSPFPAGAFDEGDTFYLFFNTEAIEEDKTYYVYIMRSDHYSLDNTWLEVSVASVKPTLYYTKHTACVPPSYCTASPNVFEDTVDLSWDAGAAGTLNDVIGYEVQSSTSVDGTAWSGWTTVCTTPETATVRGPTCDRGTYLRYRVRTQGSAGAEYYSSWIESNTVRKNSAPLAPDKVQVSNLTVYVGTRISIEWPDSVDVDNNAAKYEVQVSYGDGWSTVYTGANTIGLYRVLSGDSVQFRVRCVDTFGVTSEWTYSGIVQIKCGSVRINESRYSCYLWDGAALTRYSAYVYDGSKLVPYRG